MTTHPDVLKLARETLALTYKTGEKRRRALDGTYDNHPEIRVAIAAIERTTQLAKAANAGVILKARLGEIDNDLRCVGHHLESTLERYDHLRQQGQTDDRYDRTASRILERQTDAD